MKFIPQRLCVRTPEEPSKPGSIAHRSKDFTRKREKPCSTVVNYAVPGCEQVNKSQEPLNSASNTRFWRDLWGIDCVGTPFPERIANVSMLVDSVVTRYCTFGHLPRELKVLDIKVNFRLFQSKLYSSVIPN